MLVSLLPFFFLFFGGSPSADVKPCGIQQMPAMYKIPKDSAELMIQHFRSKKVDIDDDRWLNGKNKKIVRAEFDKTVLALILESNVISHEFFMAAFVADGRGRAMNTPTMILRITSNATSKQALEADYYLPKTESLCPPPPDCNIE
jgi:hypothetical protein